jgi:hypothetical protein
MSNSIDPLNQLPEGFADASYGAGKFESFGLKPNSTAIYRILPPMKSLRAKRDYGDFSYTHFWRGIDPRDPGKTKVMPILGIEERDYRRNGLVIKKDPLVELRKTYLDKLDFIEAVGKEKGKSKAEISKAQAPVKEWLKDHGYSGKWHLYVIDKSGKFGVLRISNKLMKTLRDQVKELVARDINPMGVKGIFWKFTRVGDGFLEADKVVPNRIPQPDGSDPLDFHILTAEIGAMALEALPDFEEEKQKISYPVEVMEALAASSGTPEEVSRILGVKAQDDRGATRSEETKVQDDEIPAGPAVSQAAKEESAPVTEEAEYDEAAADSVAQLQAALAAALAKAQTKKKVAPAIKLQAKPEPEAEPKSPPFIPAASSSSSDDELDGIFEN